MRIWATARVFLALVMVVVALTLAARGPIQDLLSRQRPDRGAEMVASDFDVPAPPPELLTFAARIRAHDWSRLGREDRQVFATFEDSSPDLLEHLDAWVAERPNSARAHMARGAHLHAIGWAKRGGKYGRKTHRWQFGGMRVAFRSAVDDLTRAAELAPHWAAPNAFLVRIHMADGDAAAMERAFRAGVAADPTDPLSYQVRLLAASPWWSAENRTDARETVQRVLAELGPVEERPEALRFLDGHAPNLEGEIAWRANRKGAALRHFAEAHEHGAFFTWTYADHLARHGRDAQAAPLFLEALEARPFGVAKYSDYSATLRRLGLLDAARRASDYALALDPFDPIANRQAGYLAQELGLNQKALAHFERALVYGGQSGANWSALASHRMNFLGDPKGAAADFEVAARVSPHWPRYRYWRARALDAALDCMAVPAYREYLAACESGGECRSDYVDWAEFAWNDLVDRRLCEESGGHVAP